MNNHSVEYDRAIYSTSNISDRVDPFPIVL